MKYDVEIIPAILQAKLSDIEKQLQQIMGAGGAVQIDVLDGVFVQDKTWPCTDWQSFESHISLEQVPLLWRSHHFEYDLMVQNPLQKVVKFIEAGASRIVIHAASGEALPTLRLLQDYKDSHGATYEVGIAVLPETSVENIPVFEPFFDYVQVMGIEHVGRQGEEFDIRALALVALIRKRYPDIAIQVDGGVRQENLSTLIDAGASRLVVGSAIFSTHNPLDSLLRMRQEGNSR